MSAPLGVTERVLFRGRVQGVGFRAEAHRLAQSKGVKGFVRNLADGSVEVVAQGNDREVRAFLDAVQSKLHNYISAADRQRVEPVEQYQFFEVRY